MRVCFLGNTHLTFCSAVAAARRGIIPVPAEEIESAELTIIADDVQTDENGNRDLSLIQSLCWATSGIVVLSSQVPPGWTRARKNTKIYHQPETLRISDATDRAYKPRAIAVGCADPYADLPKAYDDYLRAFDRPVLRMSYESAEFSKIAMNMMLAAQVDVTNRLSAAAHKCHADWDSVRSVLMADTRIGPFAYLTPGRWQDSKHLLRDYVTLLEIERA